MKTAQLREMTPIDRNVLVARAMRALRSRLIRKTSQLDMETIEAFVQLEQEQASALAATQLKLDSRDRDIRDLCADLSKCREDLIKSEQLVSSLTRGLADQQREQEGQRSAFLSQVADLEARIVELQEQVEGSRDAVESLECDRAATRRFIDDLASAISKRPAVKKVVRRERDRKKRR